jgi:hypothetical protein
VTERKEETEGGAIAAERGEEEGENLAHEYHYFHELACATRTHTHTHTTASHLPSRTDAVAVNNGPSPRAPSPPTPSMPARAIRFRIDTRSIEFCSDACSHIHSELGFRV